MNLTQKQTQALAEFVNSLKEAAQKLKVSPPDVKDSKGKAYEVWLMLEIVRELIRRKFKVILFDCQDQKDNILRVNGSPANMPSANADPKGSPCHFGFKKYNGYVFELHLGVKNLGNSCATHEIDLIIIPRVQGRKLRFNGGGPFREDLTVALELKAHSDEYKLSHDIPRALVGVGADLDPYLILGNNRKINYLSLITTTGLHESSKYLLKYHLSGHHQFIHPNKNYLSTINAIVDQVEKYQ